MKTAKIENMLRAHLSSGQRKECVFPLNDLLAINVYENIARG